jgi:hypothetical protein
LRLSVSAPPSASTAAIEANVPIKIAYTGIFSDYHVEMPPPPTPWGEFSTLSPIIFRILLVLCRVSYVPISAA